MASFGKILKEFRLNEDLTLLQVGNFTGFLTGTISRIENERVQPLERTMRKIRKTLPGFQAYEKSAHIDKKVK